MLDISSVNISSVDISSVDISIVDISIVGYIFYISKLAPSVELKIIPKYKNFRFIFILLFILTQSDVRVHMRKQSYLFTMDELGIGY